MENFMELGLENTPKQIKQIYLDYAAATPVDTRVLSAMQPYFTEKFYNPSASYLPAKHVREEYEARKAVLANSIGVKSPDLIITAGATESINLAFTVLRNYQATHCLILETEHAAVRESAKNLASDYEKIKVDHSGLIDLEDLKSKIKDNTVLVSVALANNELGTIQPLSDISRILQEVRDQRLKTKNLTPIYLHSDASQAMNLIDLSIARLGVDMLTINAAKVYGPKGIGALYVARGIKLSPITFGGGQEMGLRSGTENVPNLVGFSVASELAKKHLISSRKQYQALAKTFREIIEQKSKITPLWLGNPKHQLANFIPVCFDGLDAERLIFKLEDRGIYVSTGAACAASKGQKSHVLSAIGLSDSEIAGSLRITLGKDTTLEDIETAANNLAEVVNLEARRLKLID
jgi:aminotransferase, class V